MDSSETSERCEILALDVKRQRIVRRREGPARSVGHPHYPDLLIPVEDLEPGEAYETRIRNLDLVTPLEILAWQAT